MQIPTVGFLYIAGWIGYVGRDYLIASKKESKPRDKEIIIDVPMALKMAFQVTPSVAHSDLNNQCSQQSTCSAQPVLWSLYSDGDGSSTEGHKVRAAIPVATCLLQACGRLAHHGLAGKTQPGCMGGIRWGSSSLKKLWAGGVRHCDLAGVMCRALAGHSGHSGSSRQAHSWPTTQTSQCLPAKHFRANIGCLYG